MNQVVQAGQPVRNIVNIWIQNDYIVALHDDKTLWRGQAVKNMGQEAWTWTLLPPALTPDENERQQNQATLNVKNSAV